MATEAGAPRPRRLATVALALAAGCDGGGAPEGGEDEPEPTGVSIEELAALGYTEFAAEAADVRGVLLHDRERAAGGYTLLTSVP